MKTHARILLMLLAFLLLAAAPADSQKKLAQTGMKFLNVEPDPRAAALGGAFTAIEGSAASAFFNPAGTARINTFSQVFLGYTEWIADIKHIFAAVSLSPVHGDYGVFTLTLQSVDYGDVEQTVFYGNGRGYLDLGTFNPTGVALGLGYARALSEKFSVGGDARYIAQDLGTGLVYLSSPTLQVERSYYKTSLMAFDFGVLYKTGYKSLNVGMCIRNFSREVTYVEEGFQLPLTFRIGLSMDVVDLTSLDNAKHSLLVSVDAEHPRDFAEQVKIGAEYVYMRTVALRLGYVSPADEHGFTFGMGLRQDADNIGFGVDYAYTPFGVFGGVHRVGLSIAM